MRKEKIGVLKSTKTALKEQLTVKELINILRKFPKDALVWHEGCDCWGKADGVRELDNNEILITRSN